MRLRPKCLAHPTDQPLARGSEHRTRRPVGCAPTDQPDADRCGDAGLAPGGSGDWLVLVAAVSLRSLPPSGRQRLRGAPGRGRPPVLVRGDLNRVQEFCDGQTVAEHTHIWATRQTICDPNLVDAAKMLRHRRIRHHWSPRPRVRDLSLYDAVFGVGGCKCLRWRARWRRYAAGPARARRGSGRRRLRAYQLTPTPPSSSRKTDTNSRLKSDDRA